VALEDAEASLAGLVLVLATAFQQGGGPGVAAGLDHGDAVEGGVKLTVAAPVEALGAVAAGSAGGGDGRGAVMPGERGRAAEPADIAGLAHDLGGGDHGNAGGGRLWFLYQLIEASFGLFSASANGGGVAFIAHVGGFIFGLLAARLLTRRDRPLPGINGAPRRSTGDGGADRSRIRYTQY
jgi:hypothetical protein